MPFKLRTNFVRCALTLVAFSATAARAQAPLFSIDLILTNNETGVARPLPESAATVKVLCNFDDWAKPIDWGDGASEQLMHTVQPSLPGPTTAAGTYPLYSAHSYARAGTYTVKVQLYVHCSRDAASHPGALRDTKSYTVTVVDRLPLRLLTLSSATVKRGGKLDVTAETFADASASGTRVDFTDDKANVFGNGALSVHSDIPVGSKTTTTTLTASSSAPLGRVTLKATAGSSLTKTVDIVP